MMLRLAYFIYFHRISNYFFPSTARLPHPNCKIVCDLRPDVDFETETALIDDHILESFDIVSLVAALNDAFDIEIGAKDLVPENFNSAKSLLAMVQRLQDED